MPGPMLGVTIDGSLKKSWMAGPLIVLGHGILELLLIAVMTFGLKDFFSQFNGCRIYRIIGGLFLPGWLWYDKVRCRKISLFKRPENRE